MAVYRNIIPSYSQKDARFIDLVISKDTLQVSGGSSTHHQEQQILLLTVSASSSIG
jgi:hypothetical protein